MNEKKLVPITGAAVTGDAYNGEYVVTPARTAQTLKTANKLLTDNVTILAVPYSEASNNSGGTTFYIAKE